MGVIYVFLGIIVENDFRFPILLSGITFFLVVLTHRYIFKPKVFIFNENGFEGSIDRKNIVQFHWDEISHIEAKMFSLRFYTKTGGVYKICLNDITSRQHKEIKPKILELAKSKGVDVRGI